MWILVIPAALCAAWISYYLLMRWAFPPKDWMEQLHLNQIGRRTAMICMSVIVLASLLCWITR